MMKYKVTMRVYGWKPLFGLYFELFVQDETLSDALRYARAHLRNLPSAAITKIEYIGA